MSEKKKGVEEPVVVIKVTITKTGQDDLYYESDLVGTSNADDVMEKVAAIVGERPMREERRS